MQTQEQKTLDLIKAVFNGEWVQYSYGSPWETSDLQKQGKIYELVESIIAYPSKYRTASKIKVVSYQTRLYETTEGNLRIWDNMYGYSQKSIENFSDFKGWLESTQEHTCEYEVK